MLDRMHVSRREGEHYLTFTRPAELKGIFDRLEADESETLRLRDNLLQLATRVALHGQTLMLEYASRLVDGCQAVTAP